MTPNVVDDIQLAKHKKEGSMRKRVSDILDDSEVYNQIVSGLVYQFSYELDSFSGSMDKLVKEIRSGEITRYADLQLEMRCIVLAQAMYKATEGLGILGGQSDVARMTREQKFAEVYKDIKSGTIPDKKALAEEHVMEEKQIEAIFQRAYNSLAAKIKAGNRVLEAVKKVLTSRMIASEVFRKELDDSMNTELRDDDTMSGGEDVDDGTY